MIEQVIVCRTAFNVVQLPPDVDGIPALIASYPGPLDAFDMDEGALGYEFDSEQQTLTLSYFSGGERVGFILDPWCDETLMLLTHARSAGYVFVALEGEEATSTHACGASVIWDEMLALVGDLRRRALPRRPPEMFLVDAMVVVFDHAYYPHRDVLAESDIGAKSVNVVLTQSHLRGACND